MFWSYQAYYLWSALGLLLTLEEVLDDAESLLALLRTKRFSVRHY